MIISSRCMTARISGGAGKLGKGRMAMLCFAIYLVVLCGRGCREMHVISITQLADTLGLVPN